MFQLLVLYAAYVPCVHLFLALVLVALAIERSFTLAYAWGPATRFTDALRPLLRAGDLHAALGTAARTRGSTARVAFGVLRVALMNPASQSTAAEVGVAQELAAVRRRLPTFHFIASLATLHGLLGTFYGMAFLPTGHSDHASKATMLAKAVSESLSFTHAGLVVAAVALTLGGAMKMLNQSFEAGLLRDTQVLLGLLRTHRRQLRLEVGEHTHWATLDGPATYRAKASAV